MISIKSHKTLRHLTIVLFAIALLSACTHKTTKVLNTDDGKIEIVIVQMNDVYEISGVNGGTQGNLARVSAYYNKLKEKHPHAMLMLAGDFLNPSLINTMKFEGERIRGRQMVETLNAMDLDLVAFGNHEFDLNMDDLQKRLDESNFDWIATNIGQTCGNIVYPFYKNANGSKQFFQRTHKRSFTDADGTTATLGIFSATINSNPKDFVQYFDEDSCAHVAINELKKDTDILIGLTHLAIDQDMALAREEGTIDLIMGGHEHDHMLHQVGDVRITKADANAKTVYFHLLRYDKNRDHLDIESTLIDINDQIEKDPKVDVVISKWNKILEENIGTVVSEPYKVVYDAKEALDARESTIRHRQSNLGTLITSAMLAASQKGAIAAIVNSGSIRLDDQLQGEITGIDIFRILPFGGSILDVELKGNLLKEVLDYGKKSAGGGAFLQVTQLSYSDNTWKIVGAPIEDDKVYNIAISDFLMKGYDIHFLTADNPDVVSVDKPKNADDPRYDIRVAIIDYLTK